MSDPVYDVYDVDYFLTKFSAIPDEQWCVGEFAWDGMKCALGHCGEVVPFATTAESQALRWLFDVSVIAVNDGKDPRYKQPTPKARILAALRDLQEKQQKQQNEQ